MKYPDGTFGWVDVAVPDTGAGVEFYTGLFGWTTEGVPTPEGMGYWLFHKDGKLVAGMGQLSPEQQEQGIPPLWTSYVIVEDVDAAVAAAREAGAMIFMEPMDIMESGRMAYLADPTGASVGLWQPRSHEGADVFNEPGALTWNELNTRDVPAALAFYTSVFPWVAKEDNSTGQPYTMFMLGDRPNAGVMMMPDEVPAEVPAHWAVYFSVEDADAAIARTKELGGSVIVDVMDIGVGRIAGLADQQGAMFWIIASPDEG